MTTAAMHSSGFYWLGWTASGTGFSYTVTTNIFVLRLAVMSTHWDTCEPGEKLETRQKPVSPLKTTARTSMQPSLETKQTRYVGNSCVLTSPETFSCVLEVSIRERGREECMPQNAAQDRKRLLVWQEVATPGSIETWFVLRAHDGEQQNPVLLVHLGAAWVKSTHPKLRLPQTVALIEQTTIKSYQREEGHSLRKATPSPTRGDSSWWHLLYQIKVHWQPGFMRKGLKSLQDALCTKAGECAIRLRKSSLQKKNIKIVKSQSLKSYFVVIGTPVYIPRWHQS